MSLVMSVGLFALLQAEASVAEGFAPPSPTTPAPAPAPAPEAAAPEPDIQRPKSWTTPPEPEPEPELEPEPASEPPAEPDSPPSEPVATVSGPVEPQPAPHSALPSDTQEAPEMSSPRSGLRLPDDTGRGLMIGSIAAGALGWSMSIGTIGLVAGDGTGNPFRDLQALVYLTGVRWAANGTAMGLAIPAGRLRARYDATQDAIDGTPARSMDPFIKGGAAALGVGAAGWVVMRIGLFTFLQDCGGIGCGIGYLAGLQASFALASAGSGVLSYGLAYRKQARSLGSEVQVRVLPQLSPQYSGLSLAGRF